MERDEESGLTYHNRATLRGLVGQVDCRGSPWLVDGRACFRYARNNPLTYIDPNGGEAFNAGEQLFHVHGRVRQPIGRVPRQGGHVDLCFGEITLASTRSSRKNTATRRVVSGIVLNSKGQPISGPDTTTRSRSAKSSIFAWTPALRPNLK
jgi:hypothetical protein